MYLLWGHHSNPYGLVTPYGGHQNAVESGGGLTRHCCTGSTDFFLQSQVHRAEGTSCRWASRQIRWLHPPGSRIPPKREIMKHLLEDFLEGLGEMWEGLDLQGKSKPVKWLSWQAALAPNPWRSLPLPGSPVASREAGICFTSHPCPRACQGTHSRPMTPRLWIASWLCKN